MVRRSTLSFVCVVTALVVVASATFGQQQQVLPRQNPFLTATPLPNAAAVSTDQANKGPKLPVFTYTVISSRDGNTYTGTIVGASPFSDSQGMVNVPTQIVPIIIVTNSVFAGVDKRGNVLTAPGVTTFDPTVPDTSCLTAPNDDPLTLVQQSPIIGTADFTFGGIDVGTTQATNAFQRANFFSLLTHGSQGNSNNIVYQVLLDPVKTLSAVVINIPAASGVAYPSAAFGGCRTGKNAIIDLGVLTTDLVNGLPGLASQGVNPSTFPIFLVHNIVECEGTGCAKLAPGTACCVLGFHRASGMQTFGHVDFDTSDIFVSPVPDVSVMSHEVGEWMNDPFGHNPVPAWGHIGQQPGCQGNLEVGDPLSGTLAPPIVMPNGFTYHMQELAFFSWFYGAPSLGVNGWFSDDGTFLQDAGPVCQ